MTVSGLKKPWEEVREASKLTWFRQYDCRHTAITRLAEGGTPLATIMKRAGHISPKMTDHYTHISDQSQIQSVRFDKRNLAANGPEVELERFGAKVAMHYFARLLDSPYSRNLARCTSCRTYFEYERAPRKPIKHGVYCDHCKTPGAAQRKRDGRDELTGKMCKFAAKIWPEPQESSITPDQLKRMAARVSAKFKSELNGKELTRRWVSQNKENILEKLQTASR